jgi:3-hydroxyacyl-CoA dehydrogenase / enoyl-CoA hydratase / 3-hydroxybutyryl-CoA epimerase
MEHELKHYRDWKTKQESDGILWLTLDRADKNINTLSRDVLDELERLLDDIPRQQPAGVVICSGKPSGFIAGADITEFSRIVNSAEALKLVESVHRIFDRIEQLSFPTASIVHGFCLGGGLELALACRCRIAVDAPETRFGLPEVKLGLHPGFGGTVRLARLIGPLPAIKLMLSGRIIDARQALKIGLVDYVVPERQMARAAKDAILHAPSRRKFRFLHSLSKIGFTRFLLSGYLRRMVAKSVVRKHYPAPYAIIDLWERFGGNPAVMYREEARSVANLVTGVTAQNLIRIFLLQERIKSLGQNEEFSPRSIHVIGGGTMGGDIAAWCALQGLRVTVQDVEPQRLAVAVKRASSLLRSKIKDPRLVENALDRFIPDLRGDGLTRADVVIEAIFEDAAAKRNLYQQIEPRMRKDALLATNTSSIPLEELTDSLLSPERFVGLHFFNPVAKMQLVEVVQGKTINVEWFNRALGFVTTISRLPLPVTSSPGFLVNRILTPYLLEAVAMEEEGIPAADIDRAACEFGMPMGPILLADAIGLDICLSVVRLLAGHFKTEVPKRLVDLVTMGRLGKKSGQGFYAYKNGKMVVSKKKRESHPGNDIIDRLMLRLVNEAIACLREGIVADGDLLDAGAIFGIGFAPFRGGPLHYVRTEGVDALRARLEALQARYGNRFAADPGWLHFPGQDPKQELLPGIINEVSQAGVAIEKR